ncbi:MAG TPA: VIT1/CCC1 transporter family protein [Thermoanaerobaculia bacterium]|nr:VIT1/CCC1 transporter family protein [Thermoanaerobaculia bacterium]
MTVTATASPTPPPDLEAFTHHWQDEAEAAYLYRLLAAAEPDPRKRDLYARLSKVEERHVRIWSDVLERHGRPPGPFRPGARARLMALIGRLVGPRVLLPMLVAEEGREVRAYLDMHRASAPGAAGQNEALLLAKESAEHATTLGEISGRGVEPWHRIGSGGFLRNVVYGFNDGLTANFGLVAGVVGATAAAQHRTIIVAGVAGLIADALSMGASGYLAAKSEQEVYAHEIAMERAEVELMPEIERDELALIYELKGIERQAAYQMATEIMADPKRMLDEQVREELKIGEQSTSPLREGWTTGAATAVGALIPVLPFLLIGGSAALMASFTVAMLSHFLVGAARSIFTGRGAFRSGLDMFVVGMGVAVIGYFVGEWIARLI